VRAQIHEGKLEAFGEIAGYPKLPAGFWDGDDFCVLVGLLIFKGKTGADPAWLNFVHDKMRLMVATTESGYINTELKYEWYRRCKELSFCPFGKRATIPNADSHASNESIEMSAEMELEDRTFLVAPPGHSTHLTQQLDQTGGPIQHLKRIGRDLIRHSYRIGGKLSKSRIAQAIELALVLSFTPATCSWATDRVGWGEDAGGNLQYNPLSRPWIISQLVDDTDAIASSAIADITPPPNTAATPATAANPTPHVTLLTSPPTNAMALAAFRAGEMDGEPGLKAGRAAAQAVLGRSTKEDDGWDQAEDMEDGVIEEEGSRSRRSGLPNGRCVSSREFRESKAATRTSAADAIAAEQLKTFKVRKIMLRVLAENAIAETRLDAGDKMTHALMAAYIRARTDEPVGLKGSEALLRGVEAVRGKPLAIRPGMEPDGYPQWLLQVEQEEAARKAAKETGALLLTGPACWRVL
jgi:hypothetical protein